MRISQRGGNSCGALRPPGVEAGIILNMRGICETIQSHVPGTLASPLGPASSHEPGLQIPDWPSDCVSHTEQISISCQTRFMAHR